MKNKCKECNWRIAGIVFLYFFLFISVGFLMTLMFKPHQEFKIYREKCEEGFFNRDFYDDCISILMNYEDLMNMTLHNDFSRMCNIWAIRIGEIKSSCERFEIEINPKLCVDKYGDTGDARWCIMGDSINIKWLESNCECIERFEEDSCNKFFYDLTPNYCEKSNECSKYKCEGYFVEIK